MIVDWGLRLVSQKHDWSLPHLGRILLDVSTSLPRQFKIFRILTLPAFAGIALREPKFPFKYLNKDYLAQGLTVDERASCFIHHYRRLHTALPYKFVHQALHRDLNIITTRRGDSTYCVTLSLSRSDEIGQDREGELALKLHVDGMRVFVLAFTIVPGWVVASDADDVVLISRLQGVKGSYHEIQQATKAFHDIAPPALLVAVLQGIAKAGGISEMAGVCAMSQPNYTPELSGSFRNAYDDFFLDLGASRVSAKFFASSFPLEEKPLAAVKRGHKTRTKDKRTLKQQIADDVCRLILQGSWSASTARSGAQSQV